MFDTPTLADYYRAIPHHIRERLMKEDPAYLLRVDPAEYLKHLVAECEWQPLTWDEAAMTVEPFVSQGTLAGTQGNITTERRRLRIRVPFAPHPQRQELLRWGPSPRWMTAEPSWHFAGDVLIREVDESDADVKRVLEEIRFWIGGRNRNIADGNRELPDLIRPVLETRRRELGEQQERTKAVLASLNIPLHRNPNAEAKPIEIKRREIRAAPPRPTATTAAEPTLVREDVLALVAFIEQYTKQFEVSPGTYAKFDEEELRDLLVGMLNANYRDAVTAETFVKKGKTDICLRVEGGEVLVCECKFWSGAEEYSKALAQLFRYVTWRQNYGILLHFCTLKNMSRAVAAAREGMRADASFTPGTLGDVSPTRFVTRHVHPQDREKSVEVHHLFVDMSV